jgi:insulysin
MRRFVSVLVVLLVSACSQVIPTQETAQPTQPVVSPNEKRTFRYLQLDNQLPVLLVSDPAADKAAAALDVAVGSGDDPLERMGLAHYLEHMLFLGTDKYPNPDDYQQFIASHGGSQNAYTSFDHTNYFFDIAADQLEGALDRFAQFFIAPRFDPRYVEREINAVHSEYSSKMLDDFRRGYDVFKSLLNPAHPMSKFSVGSVQSLASDGDYSALREALIAFYQQHYSANKMRLVVYGREPLDTLQGWVETKFSTVPNQQRPVTHIDQPLFESGKLPLQVGIVPHRELRQLSLSFPIPDVHKEYQTKPTSYIGNVLGHEGQGSLLSYLKQRGWVDALSAGQSVSYNGGAMFAINMDLTPSGEQNLEGIVAGVFAAVDMLAKQGIQKALFLEQATVSEQAFNNREPQSPMGEVSQWASDMHEFAPQDILRGHYLLSAFAPERIAELVSYLRPDNMLLTLMSPTVEANQTSPHFAAPYRVDMIGAETLARWRAVRAVEEIQPPMANPFIGEHVLVEVDAKYTDKPVLLVDEPSLQLWFVQDAQFNVPKGQVIVRLSLPGMGQLSPRDVVLTSLFARVVSDRLNEFTYPAQMAGVSFSVSGGNRGIDIRLGGFSSGHAVLMDEVLASLGDPRVDADRYSRLAQDLQEDLQRALIDKPFRQLMRQAQQMLLSPSNDIDANLAALGDISRQDLSDFMVRFSQQWQVEALLAGNYQLDDARALASKLRSVLAGKQPFIPPQVSVAKVVCPEACVGQEAVEDNDSAVLVYLQGVDARDETRVDVAILANMMQSPFFQSLRTEQQLGYVVGAYPYALHGYPGIALLVQSPSASTTAVWQAINEFNAAFVAQDRAQMCSQFSLSAAAVATQLSEKPKNFAEQVGDYWQDLQYGELGFDSKQRLANLSSARECEQWLVNGPQMLDSNYPHRLVLLAGGKNSEKTAKKVANEGWQYVKMGRQ